MEFVALLLLKGFAVFDAAARPSRAFGQAGRLAKGGWVTLLALAALTHLFALVNPLFSLPGLLLVIWYLAEVRPAVRAVPGPPPVPHPGPASRHDWPPPVAPTTPTHPTAPPSPVPSWPATPPAPTREATPIQARNVLLGIGAVMVTVAAVIFLAWSWQAGGLPTRTAIMAAVTAAAVGCTALAWRRGLTATAETLVTVSTALFLVDGYAAASAWFAPWARNHLEVYLAGLFALCAVLLTLVGRWSPLRAPGIAAALVGQVPILLLTVDAVESWARVPYVWSLGLGLQALLQVGVAGLLTGRPRARGVRLLLAVCLVPTWLFGVVFALVSAYGHHGQQSPRASELPVLIGYALLAAGGGWLGRSRPLVRHPGFALAALVALAAGWQPLFQALPAPAWRVAALAWLAVASLAVVAWAPARFRAGPGVAAALVLAGSALPSVLTTGGLLLYPLRAVARPWTGAGSPWPDAHAPGLAQPGSPGVLAAPLLWLALLVAVLGWRRVVTGPARLPAAAWLVPAGGAVVAAAPALALGYWPTLATWGLPAAGLLLAAGRGRRGPAGAPWIVVPAAIAVGLPLTAAVLGLALSDPLATVLVLGVGWGVATVRAWWASARYRPVLTAVAAVTSGAELLAVARYAEASWALTGTLLAAWSGGLLVAGSLLAARRRGALALAVWAVALAGYPLALALAWSGTSGQVALVLGLGCLATGTATVLDRDGSHQGFPVAAAVLLCATAGTTAYAAGLPPEQVWTVLAGTGALVALAARWLPRRWAGLPVGVEAVGYLGYLSGAATTLLQLDRPWASVDCTTLLVIGLCGAAGVAAHPTRRRTGPVVAGLGLLLAAQLAALVGAGGWQQVFTAAVSGALVALAGVWLPRRVTGAPTAVAVVGTCWYALVLLVFLAEPALAWLGSALLVGTVASASVAAHRRFRHLSYLPGALSLGSTWAFLADHQVGTPEAYALPAAALLLVIGFVHRRHHRSSSWRAYGGGLVTGLLPTTLQVLTGADGTRALLLGLGALAVTGLGVRYRLQAPLLLGAGALLADVLVQLAPYVVRLYRFSDLVPRWVLLGVAGVLLLVVGATYESRMRELRRIGQRVRRARDTVRELE